MQFWRIIIRSQVTDNNSQVGGMEDAEKKVQVDSRGSNKPGINKENQRVSHSSHVLTDKRQDDNTKCTAAFLSTGTTSNSIIYDEIPCTEQTGYVCTKKPIGKLTKRTFPILPLHAVIVTTNVISPEWTPYLKQFYEMVGNPNDPKDSVMLAEISPLFHTDKIKAPLFISCGANDPRVNRAESDQMVAALKKRGVVVEYMVKDNEGHGFSNQDNQYDFYRAMEMFLDKYVKNKK